MNSLSKRISAGCLALLMAASVSVSGVSAAEVSSSSVTESSSEEVSPAVTINDENLRKAICAALGKEYSEGAEITQAEMESLTELDASNCGITDITGIETAVNLETLDLSGNPIDDSRRNTNSFCYLTFNKLQSLKKLKTLDLSDCRLGDNISSYTDLPDVNTVNYYFQDQGLTSLETFDLSGNGFFGTVHISIDAYPSLKKIDLSDNKLNALSFGTATDLKNSKLEELNIENNYIFWSEQAGQWFDYIVGVKDDLVIKHDGQKNLAELYAMTYVANGTSSSSYYNFTPVGVGENGVIDLGDLCGGEFTIAAVGYGDVNSSKVTINGTKTTVCSVSAADPSESSCNITFKDIPAGEYEYPVEVMHMGEDKKTYTLKFTMSDVPTDDTEDSAGVTNIQIQTAVCKKLGISDQITTHVVTKDEMAQLTSLYLTDVTDSKDLECLKYAVNLKSLSISGDYDSLPDLSGLTALTSLIVNTPNLSEAPDLSNNTALTTLYISADSDGNYPDISELTSLKQLRLYYSDSDVVPVGIENCSNLSNFALQSPSGKHSFPEQISTNANYLTYMIFDPAENAEFSFEGAENANIADLRISAEGNTGVKLTGISSETIPLTKITTTNMSNGMLPDGFDEAPNLSSLSFSGLFDTLPDLSGAVNVTTLEIKSALVLPKQLEDLTGVTTATIENASTVEEDFDFSKMTSLKSLKISSSGISKVPAAEYLPESLEKLNLSYNYKIDSMEGTGYEKLVNLKELNLSYNLFCDYPAAVKQIPNLETLNLDLNYIAYLPKDSFDGMNSLKTIKLGSMLPLEKDENGKFVLSEKYEETTEAINKANEIVAANNGKNTFDGTYAQYFRYSYALLGSIESEYGTVSSSLVSDREAFIALPEDASSITLTPKAILPDTTVIYNGKEYKSGEGIKIENLNSGINEIELVSKTNFETNLSLDTTVTYNIKVYCGERITSDDLIDGHTYRVYYDLYKSDQTVKSMSASYFLNYATVRCKDGKFDVKITTTNASYISDMDYYDASGNRYDADLVSEDRLANSATYRLYADTLEEKLIISPYVVPMGYYPKCDMIFDTTNIIDITDSVPSADLSELNIAINKALAITEKNNVYTDETWLDMLTALENAQTVAGNTLSTQEEADSAEQALTSAIESLEIDDSKLADKTALKAAIDEAEDIEKGSHTDTAWNALQDAIADAQAVYDTTEARQSEVDAAVKALNTAVTLFNSSGEASDLDKNDLADGVYSIYVDMIKLDRESKSMADNAINHTVKLEVKDGKYYVTLDFRGITIENRFGYLKNLSYYLEGYTYNEYGIPKGERADATVVSTQKDSDGNDIIDQYNDADTLYPDIVTFELVPSAIADEDGYVPLHVFVPIMEAIAEGNGDQDVLMRIDWSTLKKTTEDDPGFQPEEPIEQSPAIDYTDPETGVTVHADKGVFEEGVSVVVTKISEGADYDSAKSALADVGSAFELYDVSFIDKDGASVEPNGKVEISLPIPEGYATPAVYRIVDGKKILMSGAQSDGLYTFATKTSGKYAIVNAETGGNGGTSSNSSSSSSSGSSSVNASSKASSSGSGANTANPATGAAGAASALAVLTLAAVTVVKKRKDK